ncbi:MAG: hypothetical protein LBM66_02655 [Bifidobacteriaceae bacterium]|nr:hypothetical protein [Bifidobacteriaceae bacterium]
MTLAVGLAAISFTTGDAPAGAAPGHGTPAPSGQAASGATAKKGGTPSQKAKDKSTGSAGKLPLGRMLPALAGPRVASVTGNHRIVLTWPHVIGGVKYRVKYAKTKSLKHAKARTVRGESATLTRLKNGKRYYVKVVTLRGRLHSAPRWLRVTPSAAAPSRPHGVAARGTGAQDQIRVTWRRPARTGSVQIWVAANRRAFTEKVPQDMLLKVTGLSPKAISRVITLPSGLAAKVGSRSGNPMYVRVYFSNGGRTSTENAVVAWATPPAPRGGASLRVATYNIRNVAASLGDVGNTWEDRRGRVANDIIASGAALVGVQECARTPLASGVTQCADLVDQLRAKGSRLTLGVPDGDVHAIAVDGRGYTTRLLYDPTVLDRLAGGLQPQRELAAPGTPWLDETGATETDRTIEWGRFRVRATGQVFVALSIHLQSGSYPAAIQIRQAAIAGIDTFARNTAAGAPAVILGDFNSSPVTVNYPANDQQTYLVRAGWTSAAATVNRDVRWDTINTIQNGIYPSRPSTSTINVGSRQDGIYTLGLGGAHGFAVQAILNADGTFAQGYEGSDHQLVRADLPL